MEPSTDAFEAARASLSAAYASLERAANDENFRADEFLEKGKWCASFEGMAEFDDNTMAALAHAAEAGVSKQETVREAQTLLTRLVQLARGKGAR